MSSSGMTEIDITIKHRPSPEFAPSPLALTVSIHMGEREEHSIGRGNTRFPFIRVPLSLARGEGAARVRVAHQSGSPTSGERSRLSPNRGTTVHDEDHLHIPHTASESSGRSRSRSRSRWFRARPITPSPGTCRTIGFLRRPPRGGYGHGARVSPPPQGAYGGPGVRGGNGNQHPRIPPTFPKAHSTSVQRNRFTLSPSTAPIQRPTTAVRTFTQQNHEGLRARLERHWDDEEEKYEKIMERIGEKERYKTKSTHPPASSSSSYFNEGTERREEIERRRKREEDRVIYDNIIARLAELDNAASYITEPSTPSTMEPMSPTSPTSTSPAISIRLTPSPRSQTSSPFLFKKIATFPGPSSRVCYNRSIKQRESEEEGHDDCMGEWGKYGSTHDVGGNVGKKCGDDVVDSRDQVDERQAKRALTQDVGYHRRLALSTAHSLASSKREKQARRRLLQNLLGDEEWDAFSHWYVNCWIGWDASRNDYTWWDSDKIICSRQVHH